MDARRLGSRVRDWWLGSLQRRLLLSNVAATVFFVLILGLVVLLVGAANLRRQVEEGHRRLAVLVAKDINAQYGNTIESVELLRRRLEAAGSTLAQAQAMRDLRLASPLTYRALYLFDAAGDLLVCVAGQVEELAALPIEQTIAPSLDQVPDGVLGAQRQTGQGGMLTAPVQIMGADRTPVLYLGALIGSEGGGVLVVEIDLRGIWRRVDEVDAGRTGRALVASCDGIIIAHPDRAYIGEPLPPPLRPVLEGYEGKATYTDPVGGQMMLAAYTPVGKQSGWGIVVEQESIQALTPLRTTVLVTGGVSSIAVGMATLVTILVGRGIARPLQDLEAATREIAHTGDLRQGVTVDRTDEVGQLSTTFNQMIASLRHAEERTQRLLNQQAAVNQLALALGETRDLDTIYQTIYEHMQVLVDADVFIVALYDSETQLIHAGYVVSRGEVRDVTGFPPIPLKEAGRGTQSQVIHTGEPFYAPDWRQAAEEAVSKYKIEENGTESEGIPSLDDEGEWEDSTHSAIYVPMKVKGEVIGVMQVQSHQLDAYTQEDIELLAAMANVSAVAVQNSSLFSNLLQSTQELERHRERLEEMVGERTRELREAQEGLIRQEKLAVLGRLGGGVAHELRNPLGAIKNAAYFLNMVLVEREPDPEVRETLEILEREVTRSERIVGDLLDFARTRPPTRRRVDLNEVVQAALARAKIPESIETVKHLDEALPVILSDPDQFDQVFDNLIRNAIQAMPEGGQLTVQTAEVFRKPLRSGEATVSIADTGVGIPEGDREKIFEPLFTTRAKGIGLGLAIVKTLVEGHGGAIEVESKVGEGSTFTVRLPIDTSYEEK